MQKMTKQELLAALYTIRDDIFYNPGHNSDTVEKLTALIKEVKKRELTNGSVFAAARKDYEVNE